MKYHVRLNKLSHYTLRSLLVISLLSYVACLFTPALYTNEPILGYQLLQTGWLGVITGTYCWLSNPLYFASLATRKWRIFSFAVSLVSLLLMLDFLFIYKHISLNEGGGADIRSLGVGYYLWVFSGLFLLLNRLINLAHNQ